MRRRENGIIRRHNLLNFEILGKQYITTDVTQESFDNAIHGCRNGPNDLTGGLVSCKGSRVPVLQPKETFQLEKLRHYVLHLFMDPIWVRQKIDSMHTFHNLEPARENRAKLGPENDAKEDAREDQVGDVLAVNTGHRRCARLETNRGRCRRESRRNRRDNDDRCNLEELRRRDHELKAKDVCNQEERRVRNDLIDNGLCTIAADDDVAIGTERQDRKDQLRDDETDNQKREKRLRARRTADRLQELVGNLCGIRRRNLRNFGNGIIDRFDSLASDRPRTGLRTDQGRHNLRTAVQSRKTSLAKSTAHLLNARQQKFFVQGRGHSGRFFRESTNEFN